MLFREYFHLQWIIIEVDISGSGYLLHQCTLSATPLSKILDPPTGLCMTLTQHLCVNAKLLSLYEALNFTLHTLIAKNMAEDSDEVNIHTYAMLIHAHRKAEMGDGSGCGLT